MKIRKNGQIARRIKIPRKNVQCRLHKYSDARPFKHVYVSVSNL